MTREDREKAGQAATATGLRDVTGPRPDRSKADALSALVAQVRRTLGVPLCKVLEIDRSGRWLHVAAGSGWLPEIVGSGRVPCQTTSQAGLTFALGTPVVCDDLGHAYNLCNATLLRRHGAVSGVTVPIGHPEHPCGVLSVHDVSYRVFTPHDVRFLLGVARALRPLLERESPPPPAA